MLSYSVTELSLKDLLKLSWLEIMIVSVIPFPYVLASHPFFSDFTWANGTLHFSHFMSFIQGGLVFLSLPSCCSSPWNTALGCWAQTKMIGLSHPSSLGYSSIVLQSNSLLALPCCPTLGEIPGCQLLQILSDVSHFVGFLSTTYIWLLVLIVGCHGHMSPL